MIAGAHRRSLAGVIAGCAVVLVVIASVSTPVAAAAATSPVASRVIIVLAPYLSWDDISAEKTPAIWSLLGDSAIGNINAHTGDDGSPTLAGGALTISASRWVKGPAGGPADAAALDRARLANANSLSEPILGSLGSAVRQAGGRRLAVGASDTETATDAGRLRPAELLATDASGTLDADYPDVLARDAAAPFGLRTNPDALDAAIDAALLWRRGLIVIDTGDLSRAHDATDSPELIARRHAEAVGALDATVGRLSGTLAKQTGGGSLLMIVPMTTDKQWYKAPDLGPLIISGMGFHGQIVSSSTRRPGLATNLDLAPTILASLGATTPAEMLGKPLSSSPSSATTEQLVVSLQHDSISPGVIDQLRDAWVLKWFCYGAIVAVLLAAGLALAPAGRASLLGEALLVVVASTLPAGWLMFLADRQPLDVPGARNAFLVATLGVALIAMVLRRVFESHLAAPLFLTTLASSVILVDQWVGGPIASGLFSYSVAAGWRFYGMGNEGAAILVGASIAAVALATDALDARPRAAAAMRRFGMPGVGLVVIVTAAAPFAGANAGVAVWGIIAYGIAWAAMNGVQPSWRVAGLTLLAVAVAVAALSALDLIRSNDGQSHLARFVRGIIDGDMAATTQLVRRKIANNINYLPQTNYTGLAIAMTAALALLRFAPSRPLHRALEGTPAYARALLGIVVGSLAAWATEDSGVVMPALMLLAGAGPTLLLALRARTDELARPAE